MSSFLVRPVGSARSCKTVLKQRKPEFSVTSKAMMQSLSYNQANDPHLTQYFISAERIAMLYQTGKIVERNSRTGSQSRVHEKKCVQIIPKEITEPKTIQDSFKRTLPKGQSSSVPFFKGNSIVNNETISGVHSSPIAISFNETLKVNQNLAGIIISEKIRSKAKQREFSPAKGFVKQTSYSNFTRSQYKKDENTDLVNHYNQILQRKKVLIESTISRRSRNKENNEAIFLKRVKKTANRISNKISVLQKLGVNFFNH